MRGRKGRKLPGGMPDREGGRKIRDAREKRERNFPAGIQAGWKVKAHASGEKAEEVEF